ncbi:MAG TPA: sugar transferase [Mycobacteriales bacterium]|nr:sugar transferase [Mycobacteriales bacterium]
MAETSVRETARATLAAAHGGPLLDSLVGRRANAAPVQPAAVTTLAGWRRRYALSIFGLDALLITLSAVVAYLTRFGSGNAQSPAYVWMGFVGVLGWLGFLAAGGAYEERFLSFGVEEIKRVFNSSVRFVAAVALVSYGAKLSLSRGFVVIGLLLGTALLVLGRHAGHVALRRLRARGHLQSRLLVVGDKQRVEDLVAQANREPDAGFEIVGACTPLGNIGSEIAGVPIVGTLAGVFHAITTCNVDTVAVTASPAITSRALRRLSWELEGTGVSLLVAPGLTDVAGPRIHIRPIGTRLPLLHVEEPEFTGARKFLKETQDRIIATLAVLFLAPLLLSLAVLVRLDSRGPALFRQVRVGRNGEEFCVYKFRSMHIDAEERLAALAGLNESDGVLFKMRNDPRVTRIGRLLRRYSLDELPQLLNVVRGDMALVGPRPPLPREVANYASDVHRRLLVKPGITGLWQVSGRSDLSWEDSVRLDLYYVENWSLALDLQILWKTFAAVVASRGAY